MIALLAPFLWSVSNLIDKYLVSKYFKSDTGTLVVYSSLIGVPLAVFIALLHPSVLVFEPLAAVLVVLNSFLLIVYLFPYLRALSEADASVVVALFQLIPVFAFVLGFFVLGERLVTVQVLGGLVIIAGAVGISLELGGRRMRLNVRVFALQMLASFLIALNYMVFKMFAIESDFWTVSFWQYAGFGIFGVFLVALPSYRTRFVESLRTNKRVIIGLNAFNELVNLSGVVVFTYASLLAPVALVWIVNGAQPLFIFVIGAIGAVLIPSLREDMRVSALVRKLFCMVLIAFGLFVLSLA